MSVNYNTKIALDGLLFCLDPGNPRSYPGSGNLLYNVQGNANLNANLIGSPTFSTNKLVMNGTSQYAESITVPVTTTMTINIIYKLYNPGTGWGPLWRTADWKERIFPSTINVISSNGTYYYLNGPDSTTNIINICYSYSGTNAKSYKNGVLQSSITMDSNMNVGNYNYRFGNQSGGSTNAYVNMDLYHVAFYNRQLTDVEVKNNFEALRLRYGL